MTSQTRNEASLVVIVSKPATGNPDDDGATIEIPEECLTDSAEEVHQDVPPQ